MPHCLPSPSDLGLRRLSVCSARPRWFLNVPGFEPLIGISFALRPGGTPGSISLASGSQTFCVSRPPFSGWRIGSSLASSGCSLTRSSLGTGFYRSYSGSCFLRGRFGTDFSPFRRGRSFCPAVLVTDSFWLYSSGGMVVSILTPRSRILRLLESRFSSRFFLAPRFDFLALQEL